MKRRQAAPNPPSAQGIPIDARVLEHAFAALAPVLSDRGSRPARQFYDLGALQAALTDLKRPLGITPAQGSVFNLWDVSVTHYGPAE